MREYNIYTNPLGKYHAVKQGWSWMAFLFFWIYAFLKGRYKLGLLTLILTLPLTVVSVMFLATSAPYLAFIPMGIVWWYAYAYYGKYGHVWKEEKFIAQGYEHVDTLDAQTEAGAIAEYMRKNK